MVILDGRLAGVSANTVVRILAQRHPRLPVIRLDPPDPGFV
jgi:FixJ family two-component response regulator